ncbi:suppressor of fused domain protein [Brevibacillus choshinensis]|uniref:suppressor of fused domain protein n=1 Tax=Brevibacillus choshinensis TaxID=54911 RepID=UPI002E1EB632|nr:suppressor of fused domain protein [Brevibacillus choshinensis]MED4784054.1 suppressor of fused domain protein [Brevibacillus choshinensis]
MIVVKQLLEHCSRAFGSRGELYQSDEADVLIAVFPPTRRRGWWTYVTLELFRAGSTECLMYSYKFEREMITLLARVAAQVMRKGEQQQLRYRLAPGEVFFLESSILEASSLDFVIATPADYEEDGFDYFTNGAEVVRFMMLHAIARSEAAFAQNHGLDALEELFASADVDSLDFMRTPAI